MAVSVTNLSAKYGMENWFCQRKWFLVTNPYFSKLSAIGIKYKVGWGLGCKSKERWKGKHCSLARKERISCNRGKGRWDWNGENEIFALPRSMFSLRLKLNMPGIDYFRMESGKICEVWIFAENQAADDSYRMLTCIKRCDMFYMTK